MSDTGNVRNKKYPEIAGSVFPLIRLGYEPRTKVKTDDGKEHEIPLSAQPIAHRIGQSQLSVIIAEDQGHSYSWLKNEQVENISFDEVLTQSYRNIFTKYTDISLAMIEDKDKDIGKVGCVINAADQAASLILMEQIWESIYNFINAEKLTFIIPAPDVLMFCDINNHKGNFYLLGNAEMYFQQARKPITNKIFLKEKGKSVIEMPESEFKYVKD